MVLGIIFLFVAVVWLISRIRENLEIGLFDWFYSVIFALNGLFHFIEGYGFSVEKLFGKAFILINNQTIDIKLGAMEKEYKFDWQEIKSIECKFDNFIIQTLDNSSIYFPISKLDYSTIREMKKIISKISETKNIKYIIP